MSNEEAKKELSKSISEASAILTRVQMEAQKEDTAAPETAKKEPEPKQANNREERAKLPNEMTDAERALHYETAYFISENLRQREAKRHAAARNATAAARNEIARKPGRLRWIESACHTAARNGFGYIIHQPMRMPDMLESDTSKSRKHNHDTLWAVLAGFAACLALMVVGGLMVIAVLSYARW